LTYQTPTGVQLLDNGPVVVRVKVTYVENGVNWDHFIMLFNKVPVAYFKMITSNLTADNELTVNFPLNASVSNAAKEFNTGVAYGHHKHVNQNIYTTTHKWANVADDAKDYSVSLLENNCSLWSFYGIGGAHDYRLVLIAERPSRYSGHWSKRAWEMSWGLWGHAGDWTNGTVRKGYEFNSPLIARTAGSHAGQLPKIYSFLRVEPANIICTAVKKWEDEPPTQQNPWTMNVRFYEAGGTNTNAVLTFPAAQSMAAWESMGNEYGVYGSALPIATTGGTQKITFAVGHNQMRSIKVQAGSATHTGKGGPLMLLPSKSAGATTVLWYNTRGQIRCRNNNVAGVYIVQYMTDGKMVTKKVLNLNQAAR
jgi:hypothetical protein